METAPQIAARVSAEKGERGPNGRNCRSAFFIKNTENFQIKVIFHKHFYTMPEQARYGTRSHVTEADLNPAQDVLFGWDGLSSAAAFIHETHYTHAYRSQEHPAFICLSKL